MIILTNAGLGERVSRRAVNNSIPNNSYNFINPYTTDKLNKCRYEEKQVGKQRT
jgi:hypothetical protein